MDRVMEKQVSGSWSINGLDQEIPLFYIMQFLGFSFSNKTSKQ